MDIFQHFPQTGFNKYFSNQDTTITTLLLDQNIITELKNQNPQLLQYLDQHKHQFITQMIQNATVMPLESDGYDRCHRLPYISSELLALDSDLIFKEFFSEEQNVVDNQYWKQLLAFLDEESAVNEVLLGYFQKIISTLYLGSKTKTATVVAKNLDKFIKLLTNGSIGDILKKSLALHNQQEGAVLEERKIILNKIMEVFTSARQEVKIVCADILGEVINKFQAFSCGDALIQELLSSQHFLELYNIESSEAVNGFLIHLIKKSQQKIINENDKSVPILSLPQAHKIQLQKYLKRQVQNIRNISKSTGFVINQNKQTVRKSNKSLYPILNLLGLVLKDNYCNFVDEGLINFLWNLILLYPYNNILQGMVRNIFIGILNCNDVAVKKCLLMNYEDYVVNLGKQHLSLLRPFIYSIWFQARKYPQVSTDPLILSQFQKFVETHLEPLVKYEIKNVQKQSITPKKLIVDQGDLPDAAPKDSVQMMVSQQESGQKVQSSQPEQKIKEENFNKQTLAQNEEINNAKEQNIDKLVEQKKNPEAVKSTEDFFADDIDNYEKKSEQNGKEFQKAQLFEEDFFGATSSPSKRQDEQVNKEHQNDHFDLFVNFQASPPKQEPNNYEPGKSTQPQPQSPTKKQDFFDDFTNF